MGRLTPDDFRLKADIPHVIVPAAKGGRTAAVPLLEEGVAVAHEYIALARIYHSLPSRAGGGASGVLDGQLRRQRWFGRRRRRARGAKIGRVSTPRPKGPRAPLQSRTYAAAWPIVRSDRALSANAERP